MAGIQKLITNNLQTSVQAVQKSNKGKMPRYLYHFTTADNFSKMQGDSFCFASSNDNYLKKKAVFMFDLMNFLKDWGKKKIQGVSLQEALLTEITMDFDKPTDTLMLLRIPVAKLNPDSLKIRSQNVFFEAALNKGKISSDEKLDHLTNGAPAVLTNLFKQRKCPIEHIYQEDIPADSFEVVGKLSAKELIDINTQDGRLKWDIGKTLASLFNNAPEKKAISAHWQ